MSNFPHLTQYEHPHNDLYQSVSVSDADWSYPNTMEYQVDTQDKDITLLITEDDGDNAAFILNKEHLPFLKQLVKDLEEVTK